MRHVTSLCELVTSTKRQKPRQAPLTHTKGPTQQSSSHLNPLWPSQFYHHPNSNQSIMAITDGLLIKVSADLADPARPGFSPLVALRPRDASEVAQH